MFRVFRFRTLSLVVVLGCLAGGSAFGLPFEVPLDPAQSSLTVELCVSGVCDSDSSAVTGSFLIELDSVDYPGLITLYDFAGELTDTLDVHLDFGLFGGDLYATLTNTAVRYADPGVPFGPAGVGGDGSFLFSNTPTDAEGDFSYEASGLACLALQAAGMPCTGAFDLAEQGTQAADLTGFVTAANRTVTLSSDIDVTVPIDEANPDLGTIHVAGTLFGQADVPRPTGDVDGDGDVDLTDYARFAECLAGPEVNVPPPGCSVYHFGNSKLDTDADVDLADFAEFQVVFGG